MLLDCERLQEEDEDAKGTGEDQGRARGRRRRKEDENEDQNERVTRGAGHDQASLGADCLLKASGASGWHDQIVGLRA